MKKQLGINRTPFCIDLTEHGLEFGRLRCAGLIEPERALNLRVVEGTLLGARAKLGSELVNAVHELESRLLRLQQTRSLGHSSLFFGVGADPFLPFEGKFSATMNILKLFERYLPGHLCVQTRSPLIVIAMPVLRSLKKRVSVTFPIETCLQSSLERYTPGMPRLEERLKAMKTLRTFGIEVQAQVGPILPYGDWRADAFRFASLLAECADFIRISVLNHADEKNLRVHPVAMRLADARQFHYLRPDAAEPLLTALRNVCPEKLVQPERDFMKDRQLSIFAA